jgi:hypothetical protein
MTGSVVNLCGNNCFFYIFASYSFSKTFKFRNCIIRKDLEDAFMSLRPAVAKICPEWEDAKVYENFLAGCGSEAKKNEFNFDWHVYYAQKPFE